MPRDSLKALVDRYALTHDLAAGSIEQLHYAVADFGRFLKRQPTLRDFSDRRINAWIAWGLERHSRSTVKNRRGALLSLWRDAHTKRLVKRRPDQVRPVKVELPIPQAWTLVQVAALLTACLAIPGEFTRLGLPRKKVLRAWVLCAWYTGLRPCDLSALQWSQITDRGVIAIVQQKTGWPIVCRLPPDAMAAIREIRQAAGRDRVFPLSRKTLRYWWLQVMNLAGIDSGSPKWLRRSGATAVEIKQPGSAMAFLGHKTHGLAYKHYVDPRQVQLKRPMPPRLK